MCRSHVIFLLFLLHLAALAAAQRSSNSTSKWLTLTGDAPLVIARGGFSGIFPDSSYSAYSLALLTSLPNTILWCDVQLTKDGVGICFPELNLKNASNIANVYPDKHKDYLVNRMHMNGWFPVDFTFNDLANVSLTQAINSRSPVFDGNLFQIMTVQDVVRALKPPGLWLNIQHSAFFDQHNLSMRSFVLSASRSAVAKYISSPEVAFLRSIAPRFKPSITKLVFRFLGNNEIEPSTNQTYDSLLQNLTFVRTFASGILVPKSYIWPVDKDNYLQPHNSVVVDAHKAGLEVFASDFMSDVFYSYNFSYNPLTEYMYFIDNRNFSVDGVLSDFPITPSSAIGCFSHVGRKGSKQAKPLVISHNGASGNYPGSTDEAYKRAISDGVDVLDCQVQMTSDGIPFCLGSINLIEGTNAPQTKFSSEAKSIPEIMEGNGIFTFNLQWSDIQTLRRKLKVESVSFRKLTCFISDGASTYFTKT